MSNAPAVFKQLARARREGVQMVPRSPSDKEYFPQDWFADRLREAGLTFEQQGRNSYPDFLVGAGDQREGYEVKSLAFVGGRPARSDIDFNSTVPSGQKDGRNVFLVFFLYTGAGEARSVHSVCLAHGDVLNCNHVVADQHLNVAVHQFGSYGDGFIRNRKMYVFPHPLALHPESIGHARLIVPRDWHLRDRELRLVDTLHRRVADNEVEGYTISLYGRGQAETRRRQAPDAGIERVFEAFEFI